ncbi:hypothetical protein OG389_00345 [Streptomyces sp. NBC_00435]|uniref:terpene synthase family protein n=1 Tax=Streptomyces sp. NBC_00435 TaxID=2903649 RepID=UPI002E1BC85F
MSEQVLLPPLYMPLPAAMHPEVDRISARSRQWISKYGLGSPEKIEANNIGEAACLTLPLTPEPITQIYCDVANFAVVLDDLALGGLGGGEGLLRYLPSYICRVRYTCAVPGARLLDADNPIEAPWIDLAQRLHAGSSSALAMQFADALQVWMVAMLAEETGEVNDVNSYLGQRIGGVGNSAAEALLAIGAGLGPDQRMTPAFRALSDAASALTVIDNDLVSYGKETTEGKPASRNLIHLLQEQRGLDFQAALDETVDIHDRMMGLFVRLRDQEYTAASPAMRQYLTGLGHIIRGSWDYYWRESTHRYQGADRVMADGGFADAPVGHGRLDEPAISWWWDQLKNHTDVAEGEGGRDA